MGIIKELSLFDSETGELLGEHTFIKGSPLGEGYVVIYTKAIQYLLESNASYTAIRIFLQLMSMQDFGVEIIASKKYLYTKLGICKNAFFKAISWLKQHNFIIETTSLGNTAFILNPNVTTCGTKSLAQKRQIWSLSSADLLNFNQAQKDKEKKNFAKKLKMKSKGGKINLD